MRIVCVGDPVTSYLRHKQHTAYIIRSGWMAYCNIVFFHVTFVCGQVDDTVCKISQFAPMSVDMPHFNFNWNYYSCFQFLLFLMWNCCAPVCMEKWFANKDDYIWKPCWPIITFSKSSSEVMYLMIHHISSSTNSNSQHIAHM